MKCVQSHKAEAKLCAQIKDIAFAATLKLCCAWISNHDRTTVCTSMNEHPSFRQYIFLTFLSEKEQKSMASCRQLLLTQTASHKAYVRITGLSKSMLCAFCFAWSMDWASNPWIVHIHGLHINIWYMHTDVTDRITLLYTIFDHLNKTPGSNRC